MMTLLDAAKALPGAVLQGDPQTRFERVHTDTRSLRRGDLFVALKGERFDANQFLAQARDNGAAAALCHPGSGLAQSGLSGLEIPDSKAALGQLASAWRARFSLPLIAVTGSNGKTTVTQMLASILHAWKGDAAFATQGNLNNDIGVPLTLLRLRASHTIAVLELGMNHPGEIARLAAMVRPTIALVNNAQREHLEFMGSVQAVARENGAVLAALPADGVAVFPHGDAYSAEWRSLAGPRAQHSFQLAPAGASTQGVRVACATPVWVDGAWVVRASTPAGPLQFALRIAGMHNVRNALAAATCALAAAAPLDVIRAGLEAFDPVKGRSSAIPLRIGDTVHMLIDDSYNANPDSVAAALELLASLPAPRLMVLGDMGEVGHEGEQFHSQAGVLADELGIERMFTHGELSAAAARANQHARHFEDMPTLIAAVLEILPQVASVLVKGSRFMRMERVVEAVTTSASRQQDTTHAA
ncbi:MAG: UDP-N-acetylmuramoyl-tripeptide--D-alanyl-D-alanine ligase [Burkholderiaceae bacterium]